MDPKFFQDNSVLDKENNKVFHTNLERERKKIHLTLSRCEWYEDFIPDFNWFNVACKSAQSLSFGIINSAEKKFFVRTRNGHPCWVIDNLSTDDKSEWRI